MPAVILAILLVATFRPSLTTIILAIGAVSWPPLARLTRAEFLRLRHREFVEAAICQGEPRRRIILTHILPNALSPILVTGSLTVATAILIESVLSFLGLGDPNLMSWGFMVGSSRTVIRQAWWMCVFPGLAILITVLAINLFGEGSERRLEPAYVAAARLSRHGSLLEVDNLSIALPHGADRAMAVDQASFTVDPGEIVCLVGESGSGKSMIAHAILALLPHDVSVASGRLTFKDRDLLSLNEAETTPAARPAQSA